jgi:hypothetical protein
VEFTSRVGSGPSLKHFTSLERLATEKYSSLFGSFVSYEEKHFMKALDHIQKTFLPQGRPELTQLELAFP